MLGCSHRMAQSAIMFTQCKTMATRVPMIKFTHGHRSQIEAELSSLNSKPAAHFAAVGHGSSSAPSMTSAASSGPVAGKTYTAGGVTTKTVHYGEMFGDPFGRKPSIVWTEDIINLVVLGGAPADPPKKDPKKDAKKGGKK